MIYAMPQITRFMCVSIKYEKNKHAKLGSWYIYIEHLNKHFDIRTKDENINH